MSENAPVDGISYFIVVIAGGNSPIQKQNTSGYTITTITGYVGRTEDVRGHFLSTADTTGTLRLLTVPKHLHETSATEEVKMCQIVNK